MLQDKFLTLKKRINDKDFEDFCRENYTLNVRKLTINYMGKKLKSLYQNCYSVSDGKKS